MSYFSQKNMHAAIFAVTIGNIFEWYEIYTYIYLAPTISKLFFNQTAGLQNIINVFLIFAIGFLTRPLGGIFFGRLGDLVGRRKALILSVVMMSLPTFLMSVMPTYEQVGVYSIILLVIARLLQSFPAGGEFPGGFCYLYESSPLSSRRYMASWGAVGNQIGIILALIEGYLLENYLTTNEMLAWGWRIAFLSGSVIGLCGFFLRYFLHETPLFQEMLEHHRVVHKSIVSVIKEHRKGILKGIAYCILDAVAFYLISSLFPFYFHKTLGTTYSTNIVITIGLLSFMTITLPLFGILGDRINNKVMLVTSALAVILLTPILYYSIDTSNIPLMLSSALLITVFVTCLSALIPYLLSSLFPTAVRFTCVALSFNIVDGIIGGFSPVIALDLLHETHVRGSFVWIVLIGAVISLIGYTKIKAADLKEN